MEYKPWLDHPDIWKTESEWLSAIRGGIRRGLWEKNPIKLKFMNSQTIRIENTNPRSMKRFPTVKAHECAICGIINKASESVGGKTKNFFEVDHKLGGHSLRQISDVQAFIENIVFIKTEDLQMVCKPCHKAKSYSEKMGISQELAVITKEVIAMEKAKTVLTYLRDKGIIPDKNAKVRRQQCIEEMSK